MSHVDRYVAAHMSYLVFFCLRVADPVHTVIFLLSGLKWCVPLLRVVLQDAMKKRFRCRSWTAISMLYVDDNEIHVRHCWWAGEASSAKIPSEKSSRRYYHMRKLTSQVKRKLLVPTNLHDENFFHFGRCECMGY